MQGGNTERLVARVRDPRFPMICIAPEGTCSDGSSLLKFQTGAFVAGLPVLPILLSYPYRFFNPAYTCMYEPWYFFRQACQLVTLCEVCSRELLSDSSPPLSVQRWRRSVCYPPTSRARLKRRIQLCSRRMCEHSTPRNSGSLLWKWARRSAVSF